MIFINKEYKFKYRGNKLRDIIIVKLVIVCNG